MADADGGSNVSALGYRVKLRIVAVGRLRTGPEAELISDYLQRCERAGRNLGFSSVSVEEVEARKSGTAAEAPLLLKAIGQGAKICALDERGQIMSSPDFAKLLENWRDQGHSEAVFVIGGADGLSRDIKQAADKTLSLGKMVWPHMLARVMLSEQLYRAVSILSGSPYHRT